MKNLSLILLSLVSASALAKLPKADWEVASGKLTYHVNYPLKKVEGVSNTVKGKGRCDNTQCQFLIAVPVKSFESGDGNRDNHMLEVTKAATFPMVAVKATFPAEPKQGMFDAKLEVSFAGKSHTYEHVPIQVQIGEKETVTRGTVPLVLSQFEVERPSLLAVKIDDASPVDFDLRWH